MRRVKESTDLKAWCEANLDRARSGNSPWACPACKSGGSGRQNSDTAFSVNGERWHCHACDRGGDVFDLVGIVHGTEDRAEQTDLVAEWAGVEGWHRSADTRGRALDWGEELVLGQTIGGGAQATRATENDSGATNANSGAETHEAAEKPRETHESAENGARDYTEFYRQAHANLMASPEALAYLHGRGLTDETIERHMLGYVADWTHPKDGYHHTKRIIMPRTASTYTARAFDETERDYSPSYKKQVVGTQLDVFNLKAARGADVVVIVEGELDAASITQATGYAAVGLGSTSNAGTFPAKAKDVAPRAVWLVALDNDRPKEDGRNPGRDAQEKLLDGMRAAGLACYGVDGAELYGEHKDANEALVADPDHLKAALEGIVAGIEDRAYRQRMERYDVTDTAKTLQGLYDLRDGRELIPTGLEMLDNVMGGGLHAKSLHVIGAQSSEGKTTVTLQVADHMARDGHRVLFVTIEQRASELIAKSLARIAYANGGKSTVLKSRAITNPTERRRWTSAKWEALGAACNEYTEQLAPNISFMDPDEPPTVARVWECAEAMADRYGEAPVVFIDYLQLLAPAKGHERDSDKQVTDKNVTLLRRMAGRLNTPVWVVASLNRQSYTAPISTDSFKESGAIEYGADVLLGLEPFDLETRYYNATEKKRAMVAKGMHDKTQRATKRWMDMRVLKNRFGTKPADGLPFVYQADADVFETIWKVRREKRADDGTDMDAPIELGDTVVL